MNLNIIVYSIIAVSFLCYLLSFKVKENSIINNLKLDLGVYIVFLLYLGASKYFPANDTLVLMAGLLIYTLYKFKDKKTREENLFAGIIIITLFSLKMFFVDLLTTPTGSMLPTVPIGKVYILNKTEYGYNIPFIETEKKQPKRGDIVTFKHKVKCEENCLFGETQTVNYLKRVLAVEGDKLIYNWKYKTFKLIDKEGQEYSFLKRPSEYKTGNDSEDKNYNYFIESFVDNNGIVIFEHLIRDNKTVIIPEVEENKTVLVNGKIRPMEMEIEVPKGYFMAIGDNRDESFDSRFFGPVEAKNLIGKTWYQFNTPAIK